MQKVIGFVIFASILVVGISGEAVQKGKAKPGTTSSVPLSVTLDNSECAICSDGEPYDDGMDGVEASLDQYGNLIIDFGSMRSVAFAFGSPEEPVGDVPPPGGLQNNVYLSTRFPTPSGFMQDLPVGAEQCVELNWTFTLDDSSNTQFRLLFHRTGVVNVEDTSHALVTRLEAETWTVEPVAADCNAGTPELARVVSAPTRGRTVLTDHGTYWMPFSLTLTRQ